MGTASGGCLGLTDFNWAPAITGRPKLCAVRFIDLTRCMRARTYDGYRPQGPFFPRLPSPSHSVGPFAECDTLSVTSNVGANLAKAGRVAVGRARRGAAGCWVAWAPSPSAQRSCSVGVCVCVCVRLRCLLCGSNGVRHRTRGEGGKRRQASQGCLFVSWARGPSHARPRLCCDVMSVVVTRRRTTGGEAEAGPGPRGKGAVPSRRAVGRWAVRSGGGG